jgi:hypothetical protein
MASHKLVPFTYGGVALDRDDASRYRVEERIERWIEVTCVECNITWAWRDKETEYHRAVERLAKHSAVHRGSDG